MKVGILTAPFGNTTLDKVIRFAAENGIPCLEVIAGPGSPHIDPAKLTAKDAGLIRDKIAECGLEISSLAYYDAHMAKSDHIKDAQAHAKKTIDAAALLGVKTVCMLAGFPVEGMSKIDTIQKVLPGVFKPILTHADKKGINIALENWFSTCLQGLDTFECMFESIPHERFGLNYDPSHLYHQQCDHLIPVSMFSKRIFHTHAKDTLVNKAKRAQVGVYGSGWWRYVIPGFGTIHWGEYIAHLRAAGYDGVLSIEHEDASQTREEGFIRGAAHLQQFC